MAETPNEYAEKLTAMTDDELVSAVDRQVWLSAFASNNPRAPAHWKSDLTHAEAKRRGKPWLYQRGWNKAYVSCGHELSQADIDDARDSTPRAAITPTPDTTSSNGEHSRGGE